MMYGAICTYCDEFVEFADWTSHEPCVSEIRKRWAERQTQRTRNQPKSRLHSSWLYTLPKRYQA